MIFSRRHFFFGSLAASAFAAKKPAGDTPHILLILADNVPAWMLGCYGNTEAQTPNIDRLAQTGTRLTNHWTAAPLPAPARASLLTGRTPLQLKNADAPAAGTATLETLFGAAGYACKTAGTADAAGFIDAQTSAKPFLLTVNLPDFTPPYSIGGRFLDRYAKATFQTFAQEPAAPNIARDRDLFGPNLLANLRKAAAAVSGIDDAVGALVAKLSQKKLLDNTLVVFTAPTGSLIGRHGLWGGADASNPLNFYQEVIATPIIWSWPARIAPLGVRPELTGACDLVPTLCDIAPPDLPDLNFTGRSYLPLLQNKPLPKKQPWRKSTCLAYRDAGVARDDRYKLVLRADGKGPNELYDLRGDAQERVNQVDNPQFLTVKTQLTGEIVTQASRPASRKR